jgi:hypothetical protein
MYNIVIFTNLGHELSAWQTVWHTFIQVMYVVCMYGIVCMYVCCMYVCMYVFVMGKRGTFCTLGVEIELL